MTVILLLELLEDGDTVDTGRVRVFSWTEVIVELGELQLRIRSSNTSSLHRTLSSRTHRSTCLPASAAAVWKEGNPHSSSVGVDLHPSRPVLVGPIDQIDLTRMGTAVDHLSLRDLPLVERGLRAGAIRSLGFGTSVWCDASQMIPRSEEWIPPLSPPSPSHTLLLRLPHLSSLISFFLFLSLG